MSAPVELSDIAKNLLWFSELCVPAGRVWQQHASGSSFYAFLAL